MLFLFWLRQWSRRSNLGMRGATPEEIKGGAAE